MKQHLSWKKNKNNQGKISLNRQKLLSKRMRGSIISMNLKKRHRKSLRKVLAILMNLEMMAPLVISTSQNLRLRKLIKASTISTSLKPPPKKMIRVSVILTNRNLLLKNKKTPSEISINRKLSQKKMTLTSEILTNRNLRLIKMKKPLEISANLTLPQSKMILTLEISMNRNLCLKKMKTLSVILMSL